MPSCAQCLERHADELLLDQNVVSIEGGDHKNRDSIFRKRSNERKQNSCLRKREWPFELKALPLFSSEACSTGRAWGPSTAGLRPPLRMTRYRGKPGRDEIDGQDEQLRLDGVAISGVRENKVVDGWVGEHEKREQTPAGTALAESM